jgi:hypothetical protein
MTAAADAPMGSVGPNSDLKVVDVLTVITSPPGPLMLCELRQSAVEHELLTARLVSPESSWRAWKVMLAGSVQPVLFPRQSGDVAPNAAPSRAALFTPMYV